MSTTPYHAIHKRRLNTPQDSVVIVGDGDSRDSFASNSSASATHGVPSNRTKNNPTQTDDNDDDNDDDVAEPPVTIGLSIRRGRLAVFTAAMVLIIAGLTVVFNRGVEIDHFEGTTKNATQRNKLLDDYNSYSGNIASLFGKPIEFFVMISSQVIVLRFMAETITRSGSSWRVGATTLALGAGIGYLISNGFNALNVQLRPLEIQPKISASDLSLGAVNVNGNATTTTAAELLATSLAYTVSEQSPRNPITNTVLRNLVKQEVPQTPNYCVNKGNYFDDSDVLTETTLRINIPQRTWQSRVLEYAPPTSTQLRVTVNPTNTTANNANATVRSDDLPMSTQVAADVFLYGMFMLVWQLPPRYGAAFVDPVALNKRYPPPVRGQNKSFEVTDSAAVMYGLLPSQKADEPTRRTHFLKKSQAALTRQFAKSPKASSSNIGMTFTHVDISPRVSFDGVTFEFDMDPMLFNYTFSFDGTNATRYTALNQNRQCYPTSSTCMVGKPLFSTLAGHYDAPAQVAAYGMCGDAHGVETLQANFSVSGRENIGYLLCETASNSSMLVVSLGKRLEADALQQNMTANATGTFPSVRDQYMAVDPLGAMATNLRKRFTVTVGRLAWNETDLAQAFHADCDVGGKSTCNGLTLPLASSSSPMSDTAATMASTPTQQMLVVGRDALPLSLLRTPNFIERIVPRAYTLVAVNEPLYGGDSFDSYRSGDILMPHNVRNITWAPNFTTGSFYCDAQMENRVQVILDNHYYIEHSLQPAYTAATFFLFQNAVVKDTVALSGGRSSLNFVNNAQPIALWISTPDQNAWLTLGGCMVLVLGLLAVVVKAVWFTRVDDDPLGKITNPHTIARVMLDEAQFPPLLLNRHVISDTDAVSKMDSIDNFAIDALSLQHQQQQQQQQQHQQDDDEGDNQKRQHASQKNVAGIV